MPRRVRRVKASTNASISSEPNQQESQQQQQQQQPRTKQRAKKSRSKSAALAPTGASSSAVNLSADEEFQPPPLRPTESRIPPHRPYRRHDSVERGFLSAGADDRPLIDVGSDPSPNNSNAAVLHDNAESHHHHHLHHVHHHLHHSHHLDDGVRSDSRNGPANGLPDSGGVVDADDDDDDAVTDEDDDDNDDDVDNDDDDNADRDNGVVVDDDDIEDDTGSSLDSGDDLDDQQDSASPLAYFAGWLRGSRIGRGAFGEVYMGLNVDTGALFAEKVIELDYYDGHASVGSGVLSSSVGSNGDLNGGGHSLGRHRSQLNGALDCVEEQIAEARREIDLMRQLTHEHIVQYLGTKLTRHELSIYLEYISGGSILALLKRFGPFPARLACNYTRQTLLGLAYLHERNVIHRDIKSANLLVTEKGCVKLADFGCSKNMLSTLSLGARRRSMAAGDDVNETAMRGTPNFLAPEVITRSQFQPPSDVWSLGATVLEMLTGHAPFGSGRDENIATVLFRIAALTAPPRAEYPRQLDDNPDLVGFLDCCFAIDPSLRATAAALVDFLDERGLAPVRAID